MARGLDHVTLGAASLAQGLAYVEQRLGIRLPAGGEHPRMGTHNCLIRIGQDLFFEIIAVDPNALGPPRPRWFGLDDPVIRQRLRERPRMICYVVRTPDIEADLAAEPQLGPAIEMSRGDLNWRIGVRDDGALPEGGTLPVLIAWPDGPHPSRRMEDRGVRLAALKLRHPDATRLAERVSRLVDPSANAILFEQAPAPAISADFLLPNGRIANLD